MRFSFSEKSFWVLLASFFPMSAWKQAERWVITQGDRSLTQEDREHFRVLVASHSLTNFSKLVFLSMTVSSSVDLLSDLFSIGVDPNTTNDRGETPLHWAARLTGEAVPLLLQHGAQINARDRLGDTPLSFAAGAGNYTALKALLRAGADLSSRNRAGLSALQVAIKEDEVRCAKVLVKAGAPVSNDQLLELSATQRTKMLRGLLKYQPKQTDSPLHQRHASLNVFV